MTSDSGSRGTQKCELELHDGLCTTCLLISFLSRVGLGEGCFFCFFVSFLVFLFLCGFLFLIAF